MHLEKAVEQLSEKKTLSEKEYEAAFREMTEGKNPDAAAVFLKLLSEKGETVEEFEGLARVMREKVIKIPTGKGLLDIVGTGGDGSNSVNISTGAALLAAACGAKVAKHGSRASSSKCGSADLLEAFGVSLEGDPIELLEEVGICFLFALKYHPAMKKVAPIRKKLGIRTIFNLAGPLVNPANPDYFLLGVARENLMELFAEVIQKLGIKRAFIVYGNGMDELTPIGPCKIIDVTPDKMEKRVLEPEKLGFKKCVFSDLAGGDPETNKRLLLDAFQKGSGPIADTLVLNAGVGLYISEKVKTIEEGISLARRTLKEGKVMDLLEKWRKR